MMNSVCQNDKKNRRRKGSLTGLLCEYLCLLLSLMFVSVSDLFRLRRKREDISISSPYNFNTPSEFTT